MPHIALCECDAIMFAGNMAKLYIYDYFPIYKVSDGACEWPGAWSCSYNFMDFWMGSYSTDDITSCHMTPEMKCDTHYKHPMVQQWNQIQITKASYYILVYLRPFNMQKCDLAFTMCDQHTHVKFHECDCDRKYV